MKFSNIIVFLFFIAGCAIGPDYERPNLSLPADYISVKNTPPQLISESKDTTNTLWWNNFSDKKLNELITTVTTDNLSIQGSLTRIDQAQANSRIALSGLFPQMTLTADYIKNKTAGARFPGIARDGIEYEIYSAGGSAIWEIDIYGRVRRSIESAERLEDNVFFNSVDLINSIQAQIATAYVQLRGAQNQKNIAEENAVIQRSTVDILEKKYRIGMIGALDFERAKSQYLKTKSTVLDFDILIQYALNRIAALVGKYPGDLQSDLTLTKSELIPNYVGQVYIVKPLELINRRPDLRAAEQLAMSASAEIGVAMGDLFPKVSFIGSVSREAQKVSDLSSSTARAFNYGPNISWSILNINAVLSNIDSAKLEAKINLIEYRNRVVIALEEVENSFTNLNNLMEKVDLLKQSAEASTAAQEIAKAKYDVGTIGLLELLIAQGDTRTTQAASVQAQTELALAYINIFRVLGGAWEGL